MIFLTFNLQPSSDMLKPNNANDHYRSITLQSSRMTGPKSWKRYIDPMLKKFPLTHLTH
jgi:hypothetical protein